MAVPRTIEEYLSQLRAALRGADPALIQDALYDAEEHLRAELAEQPGRSEAEMLEQVVGSYGAPDEVAEIYRDQEIKIQRALRPPSLPPRRSLAARFFGVAVDPRTYGALFYLLLSLATGIFYFTWVTVGLTLSVGLSVLIIGLLVVALFFATVRVLSLMEGRIVEAMLGVRMPRRPVYAPPGRSLLQRIGAMFTDVHTWTTLCYMWLMLPLGILYFTLTVTLLSVAVSFLGMPLLMLVHPDWLQGLYVHHMFMVDWGYGPHVPGWGEAIVMGVVGLLLLFGTLHLARGLGRLHGALAKHMLVPRQSES
ncbi:sensor domain-containing protein [Dyella sp. A6]|uniref:sensor domain-containing protein n=1 Tax=Dyella aluminiiresistens TaxID=3069105 RepID=UPI002E76AF3A|nr:sensor domain-containing protein [Dyella sp. A6]